MKFVLIISFLVGCVVGVEGAFSPGPLLPFEVLSVKKTNHPPGKPALAVVVRSPKGLTNDVLSAVLVDSEFKILCETIGGRATGGDPCVLLCLEEIKKGDYELWIKINPYQRDKVWETNEADHLGKVVHLKVGATVKVVKQVPASIKKPARKASPSLVKRYKERFRDSRPPPLPTLAPPARPSR